LYGPGSKGYDEEQAKKEEKASERKARKDAMDDYYNYESGDGAKRGGSRIKSRSSRTSGSRIK
jgi:membrane protein involved in colicin uptake